MASRVGVLLAAIEIALLGACGREASDSTRPDALSPTVAEIVLPSTTMAPGASAPGDSLAISPPIADELAIGPSSLAVLQGGLIAVADPLRESIAFFHGDGRLASRIRVGFPADRLIVSAGTLWVRRAIDGAAFEVRQNSVTAAATSMNPFARDSTKLSGDGTAYFHTSSGDIALEVPSESGRLMSARWLSTEGQSLRWIAYEFVTEDSLVAVTTVIAKHRADGSRIGEASFDHPEVDVPPIDEFAVSDGKIYQLLPTRMGTRVRVKQVGAGA